MHRHPLWYKLAPIISNGTDFPLQPIPDESRIKYQLSTLTYGNHKSATRQQECFSKHMEEEIHQVWSLPLPPKFTLDIREAEAAPHGLVS